MVVPKKLGAPTAFAYPDGARRKHSDLRCANTVETGCHSEKVSTGTQDGCTLPGFYGVLDGRRTCMQAIILRHFEGGDSVAFQELRLQRPTPRWTVRQHRSRPFSLLRRHGNFATGGRSPEPSQSNHGTDLLSLDREPVDRRRAVRLSGPQHGGRKLRLIRRIGKVLRLKTERRAPPVHLALLAVDRPAQVIPGVKLHAWLAGEHFHDPSAARIVHPRARAHRSRC